MCSSWPVKKIPEILIMFSILSLRVRKYRRAIVVVTLTSASHIKVLRQSFLCYGQGIVRPVILCGDRSCLYEP